ncbi:MAG: ABC transporter ATP-binding protein [Christensenellaceae bacterium]|jgi:ATP-binding cassette subfamily B multidrug efflux pump
MVKLARYLKNYKKEVFFGPALKLLEAILELIVPLIMADIIDNGVKTADSGYVLHKGGLMVLLSAVGFVCASFCQYFASKASQGFGTELRQAVFFKINAFSVLQAGEFGAPTLLTRLSNDVNQLQLAVAMLIRLVIRAPFLIIGATVMAFSIHPQMALIFVAAAVLITLVLYCVMTRTVPFYSIIQKLLDKMGRIARENVSGVRVVRAFLRQNEEKKRFEDAAEQTNAMQLRVGRISALINPLTFLVVNTAIIALLWFGGGAVNAGGLSQGDLVALIGYMTQILTALLVVANLVVIFTRAGAAAERVTEVLDAPAGMGKNDDAASLPEVPDGAPTIEMENVSFTYPGGAEEELVNISLKIERGQKIGIIGGTGAGKTTLVSLIPRLFDATRGTVKIDGANADAYSLAALRKKTGIAAQKGALFSGTIESNLKVGKPDATEEEMRSALKAAQAWEFVSKLDGGLAAPVLQGGKNFSGGQRQRLVIARALVKRPEILILDDSTSALDFLTERALMDAIDALAGNMTVIVVSQRAGSLRDADNIFVLSDGVLEGQGTHEQLMETCEEYREIVYSQLPEKERA